MIIDSATYFAGLWDHIVLLISSILHDARACHHESKKKGEYSEAIIGNQPESSDPLDIWTECSLPGISDVEDLFAAASLNFRQT